MIPFTVEHVGILWNLCVRHPNALTDQERDVVLEVCCVCTGVGVYGGGDVGWGPFWMRVMALGCGAAPLVRVALDGQHSLQLKLLVSLPLVYRTLARAPISGYAQESAQATPPSSSRSPSLSTCFRS
jgi:hypothetical protein